MSLNSGRTVFKLGGSLLRLPDLAGRLRPLLAATDEPVLLVGGGELTDVVRGWHARFHLSETVSHALAMESLSTTAAFIENQLCAGRLCDAPSAVATAWGDGAIPIVRPKAWFEASSGWFAGEPILETGFLPESWDVTSDTLAACVAIDLGAEELVLLKSIDMPAGCDLDAAATQGLVDRCFSHVARWLPRVRWVNLRGEATAPGMVLQSRLPAGIPLVRARDRVHP